MGAMGDARATTNLKFLIFTEFSLLRAHTVTVLCFNLIEMVSDPVPKLPMNASSRFRSRF